MVFNHNQFDDAGPVEEAEDLPVEDCVDLPVEEAEDLPVEDAVGRHLEVSISKPPKVEKSSAVSRGKLHFWFILPCLAIF